MHVNSKPGQHWPEHPLSHHRQRRTCPPPLVPLLLGLDLTTRPLVLLLIWTDMMKKLSNDLICDVSPIQVSIFGRCNHSEISHYRTLFNAIWLFYLKTILQPKLRSINRPSTYHARRKLGGTIMSSPVWAIALRFRNAFRRSDWST